MSQILIFGASTTYGAWDEKGGWSDRLKQFLHKKAIDSNYENDWIVYNLGIDGDTTEGILERFDSETEIRIWPETETIIIISTGINDSMFVHKTGATKVSIQDFQADLEDIIKKAKKYTEKIILVGSMPVDERVDPIPWLEGYSYRNEYVKLFNEIMESTAKVNQLHFIDIFKEFSKKDNHKLSSDGVHPNTKGHRLIYEKVKNYLLEYKII